MGRRATDRDTLAPAGGEIANLEELNAKIPLSEWAEGLDGNLRGPWQAQYLVYLFDPDTAEPFTFATGTVGGGIAVRDLIDRVSWVRRFRGEQVYAVVSPSAAPMRTRYGTRLRPQFVIKRWVGLSSDGALPLKEPHASFRSQAGAGNIRGHAMQKLPPGPGP
jgi:hypothetical protein